MAGFCYSATERWIKAVYGRFLLLSYRAVDKGCLRQVSLQEPLAGYKSSLPHRAQRVNRPKSLLLLFRSNNKGRVGFISAGTVNIIFQGSKYHPSPSYLFFQEFTINFLIQKFLINPLIQEFSWKSLDSPASTINPLIQEFAWTSLDSPAST